MKLICTYIFFIRHSTAFLLTGTLDNTLGVISNRKNHPWKAQKCGTKQIVGKTRHGKHKNVAPNRLWERHVNSLSTETRQQSFALADFSWECILGNFKFVLLCACLLTTAKAFWVLIWGLQYFYWVGKSTLYRIHKSLMGMDHMNVRFHIIPEDIWTAPSLSIIFFPNAWSRTTHCIHQF